MYTIIYTTDGVTIECLCFQVSEGEAQSAIDAKETATSDHDVTHYNVFQDGTVTHPVPRGAVPVLTVAQA